MRIREFDKKQGFQFPKQNYLEIIKRIENYNNQNYDSYQKLVVNKRALEEYFVMI